MYIKKFKIFSTFLHIPYLIIRDGGKWWSKGHHLVVVKIVKNVAFSLKMLKMVKEIYKIF